MLSIVLPMILHMNLKKSNPGMLFTDVGSALGEKWNKLTTEEKEPEDSMAQADSKHYKEAMAGYRSGGSAMNIDSGGGSDSKGKTPDALARLTDLAPEAAFLITLDGEGNVLLEEEISTQLIQRNDIIKIMLGAKVPLDGVVIKGQSHVNESMITGESRPITKRTGDKDIGGTVSENGYILVKATHVRSETALSQIVQLVEAAQLARAPVQKLADKISRFFVPTWGLFDRQFGRTDAQDPDPEARIPQ